MARPRTAGSNNALRRSVSVALAAVLVVGGNSGVTGAAQVVRTPARPAPTTQPRPASPAAPALGGLSVKSDPAAATVYLDGELVGLTPVTLERLSVGEHRLRLVKEGYLENSRVISISSGRPIELQLALTPQAPSATEAAGQVVRPPTRPAPTTQVGSGGGGSGFSKKAFLLGTAAGLGGAAAAWKLLFNNKRPTPGAIAVSPTGTGMAGMTNFTFSAQGANDENGDSLSYDWNFGDGATGSGQSVTHIYSAVGSYTARVTVSDGKTSASPPGVTIVVASSFAAPAWTGGIEPGFQQPFSVTPTVTPGQSTFGGTVTLGFPFNTTTSITTGSVTPLTYPATVSFTTQSFTSANFPGATFTLSFTGVTNAAGTAMTGTGTTTNSGPPAPPPLTQVLTTTLSR